MSAFANLTFVQATVIYRMQNGYVLRTSLDSSPWLSKWFDGRLETHRMRRPTLEKIRKLGLVDFNKKGFPVTNWHLTELGQATEV